MSQRASAIMWLVMCVLCGLFTLASCGGGGFSLWHTHSRIKSLEEQIAADDKAVEDTTKVRLTPAQLDTITKRLETADKEKGEYEHFRVFSIAGTAFGLIPAAMTLAFAVMFLMKWFKKPRKKPAQEEADDEEPASEPD